MNLLDSPRKYFSEESLWHLIKFPETYSLRLYVLYALTFLYGFFIVFHNSSILYWDYSGVRCIIPSMEHDFSFDQIQDITTFGISPDERNAIGQFNCKFVDRNYEYLLSINDKNYTRIMKYLKDNLEEEKMVVKKCGAISRKDHRFDMGNGNNKYRSIFKNSDNCKNIKFHKYVKQCEYYGIIVASLSLSLIGDRFGRTIILRISVIGFLFGTFFYFSPYLAIANFLSGFGYYGFLIIYIILSEYCDKDRRLIFGTTVFFSMPLAKIISGIIQIYITDWKQILYTNIVFVVIFIILKQQFLEDSPKYLMFAGKLQKCVEVLDKFGVKRRDINFNEIPNLPEISFKFIITRFLLEEVSERCILTIFFSLLLGIINLHPASHGILFGKIQPGFSYLIIGILEVFHLTILSLLISKEIIGRSGEMYTLFTIMTFTYAFIFVQDDYNNTFIYILFLFIYSLGYVGIYFSLFYFVELYPTRIRVTCLGLNAIGLATGGIIISSLSSLHTNRMAVNYFPEFVSVTMGWVLSSFVCQTKGRELNDVVKEMVP